MQPLILSLYFMPNTLCVATYEAKKSKGSGGEMNIQQPCFANILAIYISLCFFSGISLGSLHKAFVSIPFESIYLFHYIQQHLKPSVNISKWFLAAPVTLTFPSSPLPLGITAQIAPSKSKNDSEMFLINPYQNWYIKLIFLNDMN